MGLDNGIIVKAKPTLPKAISKLLTEVSEFTHAHDFEVVYWRKCYNVRERVLNILKTPEDEPDKSCFYCDVEDIDDIVDILYSYNEANWCDSLWEWGEFSVIIGQQINALKVLMWIMQTYPDDIEEVYYYDSY